MGFDHEETFIAVAKITIVCTSISIDVVRLWSISPLDVKNAFLNGHLNGKVYAPSFSHLFCHWLCLRLCHAFYGIKLSRRFWYDRFQPIVTWFGFHSSAHNSIIFIHNTDCWDDCFCYYMWMT